MTAQGQWLIVGLGNPEERYVGTRHNVGQDLVAALAPALPKKAKVAALNVYMNRSGGPIRKLVASKKAAERLVVVHDDLDVPLGKVKISFGSGAAGHNGVTSIIAALKTQSFARIRVGISPSTSSGRLRRPEAAKVVDFVLGKFKPAERDKLKKVKKIVGEALELIVEEGVERAQTEINAR